MKAWVIENKYSMDGSQVLVFSDTQSGAKNQANFYDIDCDWVDLRARRAKEFDGMEKASEKEIMRTQWEYGWWFEYGADVLPNYEDVDGGYLKDEVFDKWWNRTCGKRGRK